MQTDNPTQYVCTGDEFAFMPVSVLQLNVNCVLEEMCVCVCV